jgi:enoyl-[acyl-carrier protein] reductase III
MKSAIVLGASSGVGNALTRALAEDRFVYGFHRGNHQAEANAIEVDRRTVLMLQHDAGSRYSNVVECIDKLGEYATTASIDVVVHSLAGAAVGSPLGCSVMDIDKTFNRLAHSYLWWVQRLLKTNLLAPSCRFIALTNPCSTYYLRNSAVIGAAKAALEGYVRLLAAELAPLGHTSNAISFGAIETPALAKVIQSNALAGVTPPTGTLQTTKDVADMIVMLATDPRCAGMNGATVDFTAGVPLMFMDRAFHGAPK